MEDDRLTPQKVSEVKTYVSRAGCSLRASLCRLYTESFIVSNSERGGVRHAEAAFPSMLPGILSTVGESGKDYFVLLLSILSKYQDNDV